MRCNTGPSITTLVPKGTKNSLMLRLTRAAKSIGKWFSAKARNLLRADGEALAKHVFSDNMGLKLVQAENGSAEAKLTVTKDHLNGYGLDICHGGVLATACDTVMAWARETICKQGEVAVNSTMYTRFFKPVKAGTELFFKTAPINLKKMKDKVSELLVTITDKADNLIGYAKGEVAKVDKKVLEQSLLA